MWIVLLIIVLYLLSLRTNPGRGERMQSFRRQYIAHRGLFDDALMIPENSLPAFQRAVEHGYGIELDVQLTTDGKVVVFHDGSLKRMTGIDRKLFQCSYEELQGYRLKDTSETIPLFTDVLQLIDGKVPMIVEIKPEGRSIATARAADSILQGYKGEYCIESFDPRPVLWYRRNRPEIIRGQLSDDFFRDPHTSKIIALIMTNLLTNFLTAPDFIAYNHRYASQFSYRLCRKLYHPVNVCYTVKNEEELRKAEEVFDVCIFDSFLPEEKGML
ncbi:MAG: hypothetical protein IKE21_05415 [Erysipelotrichaceae bacterium]|nr:hypothetical protein [Erysipelotrichaceae bacterium]